MTIKRILLTSAAIVLTAGAVQAQESPSSRPDAAPPSPSASSPSAAPTTGSPSSTLSAASLQEIKDDTAIVPSFDMNVKRLKSMDIVGADGKKIGSVDKVLGDSTNQPKAVTADVGGFLGIGGYEVIVGFDQLSKGASENELKTALSQEQLKGLERFEAKRDAGPGNGGVATGAGGQPATSIPSK